MRLLAALAALAALVAPLAATAGESRSADGGEAWAHLTDAPAGVEVQYPQGWSAQAQPQSPGIVLATYRLGPMASWSPRGFPKRILPSPPSEAATSFWSNT